MKKEQVIACMLLEATGEPTKPRNVEVHDKNGLFYVTFDTYLQEFNTKNRNGREYDLKAMNASLGADHIRELIANKSWKGEAGHPLTKEPERILTIDPKLTSHVINSIDIRGNMLHGNVSSLDDGMHGTQMTKNILQGMEPAFSLRALANISRTNDGRQIMKSKCHIVTYDWVILPSHHTAYRDKNSQIVLNNGMRKDLAPATESMLPVTESSIKNFIQLESSNVKTISNLCEVAMESMQLTPDLKHVILKESNETYLVKVEDRIRREVSGFMSKF